MKNPGSHAAVKTFFLGGNLLSHSITPTAAPATVNMEKLKALTQLSAPVKVI